MQKSGAFLVRFLLVAILALAVAEALVRASVWRPPSEPATYAARYAQRADKLGDARYGISWTGYGDLMPDQNHYWQMLPDRPFHVVTNADGFRNTEPVDPHAYRIVAIGHSLTFGPYVANEDTYPAWTENFLRLGNAAKPVQVLNAGFSGYTVRDRLLYVREKLVAFKPDLVLIAVDKLDGKDQRGPMPRAVVEQLESQRSRPLDSRSRFWSVVARHSALFRLVHSALWENKGAGESGRHQVYLPDRFPPVDFAEGSADKKYAADFREIVRRLCDAGSEVVIVNLPSFDDFQQDDSFVSPALKIARGISERLNLPLIDVRSVFKKAASLEALFLMRHDPLTEKNEGDPHYSRYGNLLAGRAVADELLRLKLIDGKKRAAPCAGKQ